MTNLETTLETLANGDLVKLYNATSRAQVNRFADRATALKRTVAAIERVGAGELPGLLRQLEIVAPAGLKAQLDASLADLPAYAMVPDHKPEPARFEVGKTYWTRSAVDHDTIHAFKITARTDKQIQTIVDGKTVRRGLSVYAGIEQFKPFGNYSMAAIISADRVEPETDPVLDAGIAAIVADALAPPPAVVAAIRRNDLAGANAILNERGAAGACGYCGTARGEYCGMAPAKVYRGGVCPKAAPAPAEKPHRVARLDTAIAARVAKAAAPAAKSAPAATGKVEPSKKQAAMIALLTRPQGAVRKELLAAMNAVAGASPSACLKLAELFGYDFHYTAKTETTPVSYRLTPKVAK